eukprot:5202542-Prymnesium_polylepis.1
MQNNFKCSKRCTPQIMPTRATITRLCGSKHEGQPNSWASSSTRSSGQTGAARWAQHTRTD